MRNANERVDAALDDALSMTFPASDPIAPFIAQAPRAHDAAPATTLGGRRTADVVAARRAS